MRIQTRLIIMQMSAVLILMGGLFLFRMSQEQGLQIILRSEEQSKQGMLENILALKSAPLKSMTDDYTFWDDMVRFIRQPDPKWAFENIDSALKTFDADVVWVCHPDGSPVHSTSAVAHPRLKELPPPESTAEVLSAPGRQVHYFQQSPQGILEVFGASVHPTSDNRRLTPHQGFVFIGRLWDEELVADFGRLLQATVTLAPVSGQASTSPTARMLPDGSIELMRLLPSLKSGFAAKLTVAAPSPYIVQFREASRVMFLVAVISALLVAGLSAVLLRRWINRPLSLMGKSLETGSVDRLEGLCSEDNEFGDLARLIEVSFAQRDQLARQKENLEAALGRVKQLEGLIPICMYCKQIRDDQNTWHQVEHYIAQHTDAQFSHGMCPKCFEASMKELKKQFP